MDIEAHRPARVSSTPTRPPHRLRSTIGLFFLAPLVGEFLLGNQPITELPGLLVLAPMYGGGAVLIREIARRSGRGWLTIVLLAAAYGLLEEGPIDQMLFNPAYLGLDSFAGMSPIPGLGISASLLQGTLTLHTVWSICVPVAIVESFSRDQRRPWLGPVGLAITAGLFLVGSTLLAVYQADDFHFVASPARFIGCGVAIVAVIVLAFWLGGRPPQRRDIAAPRPWIVGLTAFCGCSLYWLESEFLPDSPVLQWLSVGWWFILVGVLALLCLRWSRCRDWGAAHRLAAAGGALLTYVWAGFAQARELDDVSTGVALLGNVVFGSGAIVLLALAGRRARLE